MNRSVAPVQGEGLALDLVNTTFVRGGTRGRVVDSLDCAEALDSWFGNHSDAFATVGPLSPTDAGRLDEMHDLRDHIRDSLEAWCSETAPPARSIHILNGVVAAASSWAQLNPATLVRRVEWNVTNTHLRARSLIASDALDILSGQVTGIHRCPAPGCILFFHDTSSRRVWCSSTCGTRVRVARHSALPD